MTDQPVEEGGGPTTGPQKCPVCHQLPCVCRVPDGGKQDEKGDEEG